MIVDIKASPATCYQPHPARSPKGEGSDVLCDGFVFYTYLLVLALLTMPVCVVAALCSCTAYYSPFPLGEGLGVRL